MVKDWLDVAGLKYVSYDRLGKPTGPSETHAASRQLPQPPTQPQDTPQQPARPARRRPFYHAPNAPRCRPGRGGRAVRRQPGPRAGGQPIVGVRLLPRVRYDFCRPTRHDIQYIFLHSIQFPTEWSNSWKNRACSWGSRGAWPCAAAAFPCSGRCGRGRGGCT